MKKLKMLWVHSQAVCQDSSNMDYPKPIRNLIDGYLTLPGIGKKTAERLALYTFSQMDDENINISFSVRINLSVFLCGWPFSAQYEVLP